MLSRYVAIKGGRASKKKLCGKMVRDRVKEAALSEGLDPDSFSSHSSRKGATTHLSSHGVSESDIRYRGGYSERSERITYDYSTTGHGPISSNRRGGGRAPGVADIRRYLPRNQELPPLATIGAVGECSR